MSLLHSDKQELRNLKFRSQGGRCHWCKIPMRPVGPDKRVFDPKMMTFDHLTPRCENGTNHTNNLVLACLLCNQVRAGCLPPVAFRHLIQWEGLHGLWLEEHGITRESLERKASL